MPKVNSAWLANLRYLEENGADFFVTGGSQALVGLDLNYFPGKGVNLSGINQSLQQGYQTAKHIFEHVKPGTIKFVLIDLSPILFPGAEESAEFDALSTQATSDKDVDLNCERAKEAFRKKFPKKILIDLARNNLATKENFKENSQILQDYAKLCSDNGAQPIFVTFSVAQELRKTYSTDILTHFREIVNSIEKNYNPLFMDLLAVKLAGECFYGKSHLNSTGAAATTALIVARLCSAEIISVKQICDMPADWFNVFSQNASNDYKIFIHYIFCKMAVDDFNRLSKTLPQDECKNLMANAFSEMTYDHLAKLSDMLTKDDYNDIADRIFEISAEKLRHKSKIKVGFYVAYSSMWFGDDLYNLFAYDERFEPILFIDTRSGNKVVSKERSMDAERFLVHGINIFDLKDKTQSIPAQDILFCLTPYQGSIPAPFRLINLKLTTLLINFSYAFSVCDRGRWFGTPFFRVLWKMFFPSAILLDLSERTSKVGITRGFYSGYPKMDIFFRKDSNFKFDWKMTRPDAKKIIWAPHHSITNVGPLLATFHWNYQFMYEFAKAHPEISWIVKTHPALSIKAIDNKIFLSIDAYKEYMQKWDDLPNAQVYYGAYYQAIFATSDGMIQDCGSFIAEYQYVDKPMIYLTRDTQKFNELGSAILKASYLVDGKDFDAIAAMIQRVFIEGDDYKAAERKEVFNKYLNYPKANGMLASEFIYKSITDELKEV